MKKKLTKVVLGAFALLLIALVPDHVVNAATDVSDTKEGASIIEADKIYSSEIETSADVDYYKIQAVGYTNYYSFTWVTESASNASLYYYVLSEDGEQLAWSSVWMGKSYTVDVKLSPNKTYYLKVEGAGQTGKYNVKYTVNKDAADDTTGAQLVNPGVQITESICVSGDVDYYKMQAVNYTNCYQFTYVTDASASSSIWYQILSQDGEELSNVYASSGQKASANVKFEPNKTYYLKVNGSVGAYNFKYTVDRDVADTQSEAQYIQAGTKISSSIGAKNDVDWYKFYSDKFQKLTLTAVNEVQSTAYFALYDENGKEVIDTYAGTNNKTTKSAIIDKGNYYLRVKSTGYSNDVGNYNFTISVSDVPTSLKQNSWGDWLYYVDGTVDYSKTGIVYDQNVGWWYVNNGEVDFDYNDLYCDSTYGWWKITNGAVDFNYNGLFGSPTYGWWLISNGQVNFGYTDLYGDANYGWWKVSGGTVDFGYNGLYYSPSCGWWLISGGAVNFGYTDLYGDANYGWWKVSGGAVDFGYNGLYCSPSCGWWLISGGAVNFGYADLYGDTNYGWWKVSGGSVDFGYTGWYGSPSCGNWYINGGAVVF